MARADDDRMVRQLLLFVIACFALPRLAEADDMRVIRAQARAVRDKVGAFSPAMGERASQTFALGESALRGRMGGGWDALHVEEDANGASRLTTLSVTLDSAEATRIVAVGKNFEHDTVFERSIHIAHGDTGRIRSVTATARYVPRGASGRALETTVVERRLPLGLRITTHETRRQEVRDGATHVRVLARTRELSLGSFRIRLPGALRTR